MTEGWKHNQYSLNHQQLSQCFGISNETLTQQFSWLKDLALQKELTWEPDQWTYAFMKGLSVFRDSIMRKNIIEVGAGSGIVTGHLLNMSPSFIIATDINAEALTHITKLNLAKWKSNWTDKVQLVGSNLLNGVVKNPRPDTIVACIPQVQKPANINLEGNGPALGNYYDFDHIKRSSAAELEPILTKWNEYGLALNAQLLAQAYIRQNAGGQVILNLGGRPGQRNLIQMFNDFGYSVDHGKDIIRSIVPQDPNTNIISLVDLENNAGHPFEFFIDENGQQHINAAFAHSLMTKGLTVYHAIYQIRGTKNEINNS